MPISVFIADDHAIIRDGLRAILEAEPDIRVIGEAANGRQALQQVIQLNPDVVILDISMPVMNGIETAQEIRQNRVDCKIFILSMYASQEYIYRAFQAKVNGYLLKDSAGKEVVEAVKRVYAGERYLSAKITDLVLDDYFSGQENVSRENPVDTLSLREREVLQLVVEGSSSLEIANHLGLSVKSIETYRSRLMQKLGINDLPGLVKFALQHGLTDY